MRVLVFGNSITQGFWDIEGGWVQRIRRRYDQQMIEGTNPDPPTIFNLGVSADSSTQILARLENETKARANQEVAFILATGVNDARTKAEENYTTPEIFENNIREIVTLMNRFSSKVLITGLTPCVESRSNPVAWGDTGYTNDRIQIFDDTLRNVSTSLNIPFVDVLTPFTAKQAEIDLLPDGLHPNSEGHELIASLVLPELEILLTK